MPWVIMAKYRGNVVVVKVVRVVELPFSSVGGLLCRVQGSDRYIFLSMFK